ncbi:MAG: hypothetical protein M3229_02330 [Actinomycetota bacterium]|nr:hypothetical protein [Actinomycetota bacterium]
MKKLQTLVGIALALGPAAVAAAPAAAERGSYNNWHVHDGRSGVDANGLVHRGLAFFPDILTGGDVGAYLQDPAYCPDATDKLTLPAGSNGQFPLVGNCFTDAFVIHLRAIPAGHTIPPGYVSTGSTTGGAVVYYALTSH